MFIMKNEYSSLSKMGALWATMYYSFAEKILEDQDNADEAANRKEILIECIRNYGKKRGEAMASYVKSIGEELSVENFVKYYDAPFSDVQAACLPMFEGKNIPKSHGTTFCPYYEIWSQFPKGKELGLIYCKEFHVAMWQAFHPDLRVKQEKIMAQGDDICTFETYMEGDEENTLTIFDQN